MTWFTGERPSELEKYFLNAVPQIGTMGQNISIIQQTGYTPVAAFALSENCWTDNYFAPQKSVNEMFLKKYAGNKAVEAFISNMLYEAELYSKYKQHFGYVFYIGKRIVKYQPLTQTGTQYECNQNYTAGQLTGIVELPLKALK